MIVAAMLLAPAAAAAESAFVRVDQVGYSTSGPKRAYVMSSADQSGRMFMVRSAADGMVVFTGSAGPSLGAWSGAFPHVHPLDFDTLVTPGRYTISLAGEGAASSPVFAIGPAASILGAPLANSLAYYQSSRDGPTFIASALRTAPGHLNDAGASTYLTPGVNAEGSFGGDLHPLGRTIDAAGAWWDAGDYLKFVQTTSYTVDMLLAGVRDFPAQMGAAAGPSDFTAEAQFGLEWLLRMWDDQTRTLYYQVGIGNGNSRTVSDHDIWRLPQADDTYGGADPRFRYIRHRPAFRAAPPGAPVSPNLAGRDAAAFALCFQVFHASRPELAGRCLLAAEHIFDLANTHVRGRLLTVIPFGFYPESEWRDDLELGATELAIALSSPGSLPAGLPHSDASFYLQAAAHWARAFISRAGGASDPLNLYDVSGFAHFELARALRRAGDPGGLEVTSADLLTDLRRQLLAAAALSRRDPFGFGFPWNTSDTASHGNGLAVMAAEYEALSGEQTFRALGARWLGNVLGANAWGASLIIGDGTTFPHCPQHQVANIAGSLDGSQPVLAGAVVEGPSAARGSGEVPGMRACPPQGGNPFAPFDGRAVFADEVQSFTTVEPAIDLSATSPLAFSWQIAAAQPLALRTAGGSG